jgi:hypothetical protein
MTGASGQPALALSLSSEEIEIISELLENGRDKLLVEIRRTDHRVFREELRHRLAVVENVLERTRSLRERATTGPSW